MWYIHTEVLTYFPPPFKSHQTHELYQDSSVSASIGRLVQKVDKELQKGWNIFACNLLLSKITSAVLENCVGVSYRFKALSQFNANHA